MRGGFNRIVTLRSTEYAERVKLAFEGTGIAVYAPTGSICIIITGPKIKRAIEHGELFEM